ncbi:MAG: hypothetical protein C4523_16930 [Myxococcales bacterium]|nr:MAG: hypothetical protein C4523_16930 [Myxococcales bacterium]
MPEIQSTHGIQDAAEHGLTLVAELVEEHQSGARWPINTETVNLYRLDDGRFRLVQSFQFAGMEPHHEERHEGQDLQNLLASISYPTDAVRKLIGSFLQ